MKRFMKYILIIDTVLLFVSLGVLMADKETLHDDLIRMHIVANSNSAEDQTIKHIVKKSVVAYLEPKMMDFLDRESAMMYLGNNLDDICCIVNTTLQEQGSNYTASVSLKKEAFPMRDYETFSLPSGVYNTLRITIGGGEGENWWCVVFPTLCAGATAESVDAYAVGSGFSPGLSNTLTKKDNYNIRFFLLDCIGKLENLIFGF